MAAKKRARRAKKKAPPARRVAGNWVPIGFFLAVLLALGFLLVAEGLNYFAHPSVEKFEHPSGSGYLVLYHRTERARAADVFFEKADGELMRIAPVFYSGKDRSGAPREKMEELRWTQDGGGVVALGEQGRLLWVYDTGIDGLFAGAGGQQRLAAMGGVGRLVVRWFELGATEGVPRLWSWEATRYENKLK